jgi:hypothetical protein
VKKYAETSSKTLNTNLTVRVRTHRFAVLAFNPTKWELGVNATAN